jgi:hypothetical protein
MRKRGLKIGDLIAEVRRRNQELAEVLQTLKETRDELKEWKVKQSNTASLLCTTLMPWATALGPIPLRQFVHELSEVGQFPLNVTTLEDALTRVTREMEHLVGRSKEGSLSLDATSGDVRDAFAPHQVLDVFLKYFTRVGAATLP